MTTEATPPEDNTSEGTPPANPPESNQAPTFNETLSESIRGNDAIKGFATGDALAQAFIDTQGKLPVVPENYELGDQLKGTGFNKAYAEMAKDSGLTQEQAAKGYEMFAGLEQAGKDSAKAESEKLEVQVKEMWKGADYDKNIASADNVAQQLGDDFATMLKDTGMNRHPLMLKTLHAIGKAVSEDSFELGDKKAHKGERSVDGTAMLSFPSMDKK